LREFFADAQTAAAEVGALLDTPPELDGRRQYLPNLDGRQDQRQFCIASIDVDADGTAWPCITFKSFKRGGSAVRWKPRDLAWQHFRTANDNAPTVDRAAYAERIARERAKADARAAQDAEREHAAHAACAEAAASAWAASAPASDDHSYLARKRTTAHGLRVAATDIRARLWSVERGEWMPRALAVRAGDLLVPMHDERGKLWNLQRIAPNGEKRFLAGGRKRGLFYRIGAAGPAWLAEGFATAATVHAADGAPAVVAFDAGNLAAVAAALAGDLFAVAADHDGNGAGQKGAEATGLPYIAPPAEGDDWNDHAARCGLDDTGALLRTMRLPVFARPYALPAVELSGREEAWLNRLQRTAEPADAAALAWAICRRLAMRVPVLLTLDQALDTVRRHVHPATLDAMRCALARIIEWRRRRALLALTIAPETLPAHDVEVHDALPTMAPADYHGIVLVQAPMGSGKTQRIGRPFAQWASRQNGRFLATCHRQSLVAELARVLGCEHYQDITGMDAWRVDALATCLPSIVKGDHAQIVREAGYVFVDEVAQVLRSLASRVTVADGKTRPDVFHQLRELVRGARCIIGADAGMDDRTVRFLEACRPGERFRIIQVPNRDEGLSVRFGFGPEALAAAYGEALALLSEGKRLWIACGEKSRAIEAARVLSADGARVLLLHGDNRENAEQAAFWRDPEAVSRQYQAVIHTGVISSGLSIEHRDAGPRFDHGMLLASGATITPADALQMLRRVRYLRAWTVAVTPNNHRDVDNPDAILTGMQGAATLERLSVADASDFDRLIADIEASDARHRADFAAGLWWALEHQRFAVERMPLTAADGLALDLKQLRAQLREEREQALLQAPDISEAEAMRLRDDPHRTEAESVALLRHRIKRDCGTDTLDTETLAAWDDGRGPRQWDRFTAATEGRADMRDHHGSDLALHRFGRARVLAYQALFGGIDLAPGLRVTPDTARAIVQRVIERRFLLAYLGVVPAKWARDVGDKPFPLPAYPTREVGEILERMGLETRRRRSNTKARMGATSPVSTLGVDTPCGTQGRQIVATDTWHEVTAESWEYTARWADLRNTRNATAVVREPVVVPLLGRCLDLATVGKAVARVPRIGALWARWSERLAA
jgi:putative DNA primase/helicase